MELLSIEPLSRFRYGNRFERLTPKLLIIKFLRIMQLTAVFLFACLLQVVANTNAQNVTLKVKDASLESVLQSIKKQSGYTYIVKKDVLGKANKVTLNINDVTVNEALALSFKNQPFTYTIDGKIITIITPTPGLDKRDFISAAFLPSPPITVRGRIVNENGEAVIATIVIKGTKRGTTTNLNGDFELNNVDENAVLIISGISIEIQEIKVDGRNNITITTTTKIKSEEEITVSTGYWKSKKSLSTGSIVKVEAKDIEKQPVTSPLLALQGRVAGMDVVPENGVPGTAVKIQIRGNNSLRFDGSYPLYVVDGVPINSSPVGSAGTLSRNFDPLANINPSNIESIEVLKDAAATAIYGSRGANGVILIQTKQNKKSGKTDFETSFYTSAGQVTNRIDVLNSEQYLAMRREAFQNAGQAPGPYDYDINYYDSTRDTNWQDALMGGIAKVVDVQTTISGGNARTSFRLGGNFHQEKVIYPGDFGYRSLTGNFTLSHHSGNEKFHLSLTVNYGKNLNKLFSSLDYVDVALRMAPNSPELYTENGELNWAYEEIFGNKVPTFYNPLAKLQNTHESKSDNLITSSVMSYEVFPGLTLKLNSGFTNYVQSEIIKNPMSANPSIYVPYYRGRATFGDNKRQSWILEPQVSYQKNIGSHNINVVMGATAQSSEYSYRSIIADGYSSDVLLNSIRNSTSQLFNNDDDGQYKYISVYGRIGYNWNEKYLIDLIGRRDGSSRFGPSNKFGNFGAIGTGWIFSKESFIKNNIGFLSFGKIKGSYGITGNDQIGDYRYYNMYNTSPYRYQNNINVYPAALFNPDFKWESTTKFESSLELGFFKDRVSTQVAWYKNISSNQLTDYTLPVTTGFRSVYTNFDATIQNTGWEITVNTKNISRPKFSWATSFNLTIPRNKLVKFDGIENSSYRYLYTVGQPLNTVREYKWTGVDQQTGIHTFQDINKDGELTEDDIYFNSSRYRSTQGGLNNSFQYRNFELSFLFQLVKQKSQKLFASVPGVQNQNQPTEVLKRWQKPGDITDVQQFWNAYYGNPGDAYNFYLLSSSYNIQDGSFARLKTLLFSYRFSNQFLKKINVEDTQIYFQAQNLLTITNFVGLDPETLNSLPPLKMLTLGIHVKL